MAKITIDTDALVQGIQNISGRIGKMQETNSMLQSIAGIISSSWTGSSSEAYTEKMNEYIEHANKLVQVLEEYQNYVKKANETFSKLDSDSANKLRASF